MATEIFKENTALDTKKAEEIVAKVRALVEQDDILEARRLLAAARQRGISSSQLERWQQVLAAPKAKSSGQASGHRLLTTVAWLQQHRSEYQGQWVALLDGKLLGANPNRVKLQQSLQQTGNLQGTTFVRL